MSRKNLLWTLSAWVVMAIPACAFYFVLWKNAVDVPILDDYFNILLFADRLAGVRGVFGKISLILTAQHNEYKLIFENAVVASQYLLNGRVEFLSLVAFGNIFPLLIFVVVVAMVHDQYRGGGRYVALVPLAYLIFQLQYASALDWASSSLQHMAVIFFALLTILLLSKPSAWSFGGACAALVLSIFASGNGFFVVPIGVLSLAQDRRWKRLSVWALVTLATLMLYLWRYDFHSSQTYGRNSVIVSFAHISVIYFLSFLGSSAARYRSVIPSAILGLVLLGIFLAAVRRKYFVRNRSVFYSMLFVVITAIGVSGLRSGFGVAQSLASRYRLYSNLMVGFCYLFILDTLIEKQQSKTIRRSFVGVTVAFAMAFCLFSTAAGARFLAAKKQMLMQGVEESPIGPGRNPGVLPAAGLDRIVNRQAEAGVYKPQVSILKESAKLGIYRLPERHSQTNR